MIKDKKFLTGLGSGLIVGAILLQLMNVAASGTGDRVLPDQENTPAPADYTVQQLTDIADQLGYQVYDKKDKRYTEQEVQTMIAEAVEKERADAAKQAKAGGQPSAEKPADAEPPKEQPAKPVEETKPAGLTVTIRSGMSSDEVADALVAAKLVSDAEAFKNELTRLKKAGSIQVGTFTFDKKPTLTELINRITKS